MIRLKYALTEEKGERDMSDSKRRLWTIPNVLTLIRLILVPVYWVLMLGYHLDYWALGAFLLASATDMLDGFLARRMQCITDFGKLMDPLADKFMVIGALTVIVYRYDTLRPVFIWALLVVVFRELAVTSLRLVASTSGGVVVPANMLGKIKTVSQIVCVSAAIIEPMLYEIPFLRDFLPGWWTAHVPLTYITCAAMTLFTVLSGVNYFRAMWKYLDPGK